MKKEKILRTEPWSTATRGGQEDEEDPAKENEKRGQCGRWKTRRVVSQQPREEFQERRSDQPRQMLPIGSVR